LVFAFGCEAVVQGGCSLLQGWGYVEVCPGASHFSVEIFNSMMVGYLLVRFMVTPLQKWGVSLHSKIRDEHYLIGRKLVSTPSKHAPKEKNE
jgi:hypothetical protein